MSSKRTLSQIFGINAEKIDFTYNLPNDKSIARAHVFYEDSDPNPTVDKLRIKQVGHFVTAFFRTDRLSSAPTIFSLAVSRKPNGQYACNLHLHQDPKIKSHIPYPGHLVTTVSILKAISEITKNPAFLSKTSMSASTALIQTSNGTSAMAFAEMGPFYAGEMNAFMSVWQKYASMFGISEECFSTPSDQSAFIRSGNSVQHKALEEAVQEFNATSMKSGKTPIPHYTAEYEGPLLWTPRDQKDFPYTWVSSGFDASPPIRKIRPTFDLQNCIYNENDAPEKHLIDMAGETFRFFSFTQEDKDKLKVEDFAIEEEEAIFINLKDNADTPTSHDCNLLLTRLDTPKDDNRAYGIQFLSALVRDQVKSLCLIQLDPKYVLGDMKEMLEDPSILTKIRTRENKMDLLTEAETNTLLRVLLDYASCRHHYTNAPEGNAEFYPAQEKLEESVLNFTDIYKIKGTDQATELTPTADVWKKNVASTPRGLLTLPSNPPGPQK